MLSGVEIKAIHRIQAVIGTFILEQIRIVIVLLFLVVERKAIRILAPNDHLTAFEIGVVIVTVIVDAIIIVVEVPAVQIHV